MMNHLHFARIRIGLRNKVCYVLFAGDNLLEYVLVVRNKSQRMCCQPVHQIRSLYLQFVERMLVVCVKWVGHLLIIQQKLLSVGQEAARGGRGKVLC